MQGLQRGVKTAGDKTEDRRRKKRSKPAAAKATIKHWDGGEGEGGAGDC